MSVEYPPIVAEIIKKLEARQPLPRLVPEKEWDSDLTRQIQSISLAELFDGQTVKETAFGDSVKSGLLLWNDALAVSHTIAQKINNKTGSYWHGIMHRREPDYSNAKYWFGRVNNHPIFLTLRKRILDFLKTHSSPSNQLANYVKAIEEKDNWDAFQFIDWCQAAEQNASDDVIKFLQTAQVDEIKLLLDYSYQNALA